MDKITVLRKPSEKDWTLSDFYFDNIKRGVGIEDEKRDVKVKGETAIPANTYPLALHYPSKFSTYFYRDDNGELIDAKSRTTPDMIKKYHTAHEMIWVTNVPGFEYILWHWGNTDDDTEGCYIVGCYVGKVGAQSAVLESKKKYREIYPEIWRAIKNAEKNGKKIYVEYK